MEFTKEQFEAVQTAILKTMRDCHEKGLEGIPLGALMEHLGVDPKNISEEDHCTLIVVKEDAIDKIKLMIEKNEATIH